MVTRAERPDFALLSRLHPAASQAARLAEETPATYLVFDVLAVDGDDLRDAPLWTRREHRERLLAGGPGGNHVVLSPATTDRVRDATEAAARSHGWVPERWYESIRDDAIPRLATVQRAVAVARRAALTDVDAVNVRVSYSRPRSRRPRGLAARDGAPRAIRGVSTCGPGRTADDRCRGLAG